MDKKENSHNKKWKEIKSLFFKSVKSSPSDEQITEMDAVIRPDEGY